LLALRASDYDHNALVQGIKPMLSPEFLEILRCPEDHSRLSAAGDEIVARLNVAVASGRLQNRGGRKVEKHLDGALLRADGKVAYPIIDQIPVLLVDEGIFIGEVSIAPGS
jgi:uncharacterized protein